MRKTLARDLIFVAVMTEIGCLLGTLYPEQGIRIIMWLADHHILWLK